MSSPLVFLVVLLSCGRHLATVRGGVIPTTMSSSAVSGPDVGPTTDGNVVTSGTDAQVTTDAKQAETDPTTTDVTSATDAQVSTDATQADADPTTTDVTSGTDAQVTTDVTQADADPTTTDVTSATDAQVSTLPTQTASDVLEQTTTEEDPSTCNHDDGATPSNDETARAARSSASDDSGASPCLVLTAAQVAELYGNCTARLTGALAYPSYPANGYNRPCPDDDSQACSDLETGPQSDRPVCPWSNKTHEDPNMSPTAITYVQCRTPFPRFKRGSMDPTNYYCDHVYYTKRVLVKEGAACDQGFRYKCVELKIANACVAYIS